MSNFNLVCPQFDFEIRLKDYDFAVIKLEIGR
jgi:hypothetical protein